MRKTMTMRRCRECGIGRIRPVAKAGRRTRYKAMQLEIPRTIEIPTCENCGAEWMDRQTAQAIDRSLEPAYRETLRAVWAEVMRRITAQTSMRRVEQALGLSEGYLSKVTNGRSRPSPELICNLGLIASDVESRLREIERIWRRARARPPGRFAQGAGRAVVRRKRAAA